MDLVHPTNEQHDLLRKLNNEDINTRDRDLEALKEWLRKEPHLPDTFDEAMLLNFLRMCKFSLETAKRKLDMYFTMKTAVPEFFANRDVTRPELKKLPKLGSCAVMPGLTPDGKRVTIAINHLPDFDLEDTTNLVKLILMIGDVRLHIERGVHDIYILDGSVIQFKNLSKVSLSLLKKFLVCVQEAYPVRIKEVHVINATPILNLAINWATHFVKEKLMKRVKVHPNLESLHKCVPKSILPEELEGTAGKLSDFTQKWMVTLEEYGDWFKELDALKVDESKRIGRKFSAEDLFGMEGSFKQLSID